MIVFLRSVCCNNVFHSGKQTGIVVTTAHYLKHILVDRKLHEIWSVYSQQNH